MKAGPDAAIATPAGPLIAKEPRPVSIIQHDSLTDPTLAVPATPACPPWCSTHDITPDSDGSVLVLHHSTVVADAAGYEVGLRSCDVHEPDGSTVTVGAACVMLDGEELDPADARRLIAALALAAELATGGVQ